MKNETISESTRQKAEEVKKYIQKKYNLNRLNQEQQLENWNFFQQKVKDLNLNIEERQQTKNNILHQQMQCLRKKREKISKRNFQSLSIIGRGAFGEVRLCREKANGRIVAIKCLKKKQMIKKNQQMHLKAERNILADGGEWIVNLLYSFQDQTYLYLVMDYLAGGDLMNLLILRNVILQQEAKFYAAQIILAIESIHLKDYIHRDLKPDNVLIDRSGHIKLSDFGLCKKTEVIQDHLVYQESQYKQGHLAQLDIQTFKHYLQKYSSQGSKRRKLAFSAVGTPDYIAPEMLKRVGYSELVDWWALGVMIYEMIIGYAPFSAEANEQIYYKIQHHDDYLYFPPEMEISYEVIDLISRLLSHQDVRLGKKGAQQIKSHKWFQDINWADIKNTKPPFVPHLQSKTDTKYFDNYEEEQPWTYEAQDQVFKKDFNFIGYTYKMQRDQSKDIIKQELQKLQKLKTEERNKIKPDMKKKKIMVTTGYLQHHDPHHYKPQNPKILLTDYINTESNTERTRNKKSKSPLQLKDMNRLKTKQSVSKSPIKIQRIQNKQRLSALPKKMGLANSIAYGGDMNRTLTVRKSVKKCK